ncbi:hypothetical protein SHJG_p1076 (plasmid) [Streptomyces hygroscopicus subsp. jinggangensis 5008]|nr:hypothetical protein SHJG_p1076 [Streptomyces hygroscopicus subsp. jinggangensis 5008]AGF68361.1 hypothetical protein SHJGH_p1076 [Streptomyces hygroscopicus subsp. jinggangensis TL01]
MTHVCRLPCCCVLRPPQAVPVKAGGL